MVKFLERSEGSFVTHVGYNKGMKEYVVSHRKPSGLVGALVALTIAYVYYFVVPAETSQNAIMQSVLTYGHSLCWLLLANASLLWGFNGSRKWYSYVAYAALVTYIVFITVFTVNKLT